MGFFAVFLCFNLLLSLVINEKKKEKRIFSKRSDAGLLFALRLAGGSEKVPHGFCPFLLYWENGSNVHQISKCSVIQAKYLYIQMCYYLKKPNQKPHKVKGNVGWELRLWISPKENSLTTLDLGDLEWTRYTAKIQNLLSLNHLKLKQYSEKESLTQTCLSKKYYLCVHQSFSCPCHKLDSLRGFVHLFCGGAGNLQLLPNLAGFQWGPWWADKRGQG